MNINELKNINTISIIGHLIVSNKTIHNYQLRYIERYMKEYPIKENYSILNNIFNKSKFYINLEDAIRYFKNGDDEIKKDLIKHLIVIAELDGGLDIYEYEILNNIYPEYIEELD